MESAKREKAERSSFGPIERWIWCSFGQRSVWFSTAFEKLSYLHKIVVNFCVSTSYSSPIPNKIHVNCFYLNISLPFRPTRDWLLFVHLPSKCIHFCMHTLRAARTPDAVCSLFGVSLILSWNSIRTCALYRVWLIKLIWNLVDEQRPNNRRISSFNRQSIIMRLTI